MRTALAAASVLVAIAGNAAAQTGGSDASRAATDTPAAVTTAAQAAQAKDDTPARLEGTIVRQIRHDKYEFRDASGTVTVEIDDDEWPDRKPVLNSRVRIDGEVERKRIRRTVEVEVDRLEILK